MNNTQLLLPIPLPCGCIADIMTIRISEDRSVMQCPWCSGTFGSAAFRRWFESSAPMTWIERGPRTLFKHGDRVLEAMERCSGCNAPVARECGGERFHLRERVLEELELLQN